MGTLTIILSAGGNGSVDYKIIIIIYKRSLVDHQGDNISSVWSSSAWAIGDSVRHKNDFFFF